MNVVDFPAREPRPRITQELLATMLINKAVNGDTPTDEPCSTGSWRDWPRSSRTP